MTVKLRRFQIKKPINPSFLLFFYKGCHKRYCDMLSNPDTQETSTIVGQRNGDRPRM
jgi:hypothetical protein